MPSAREWPTKAEHYRQDGVALFLDVQYLAREIQAATLAGDGQSVMRLSGLLYRVGAKGQQILQEARRV